MANDSRCSRKSKDDEINSKKKLLNGKGSSPSGSGTADTFGLRRSVRETSSRKQMTSSPSNTRKSERLEKRMPTTPPVKKKSERVEKQRMPSPLRRSDRGKKHTSSSSSGSKKSEKGSGSSDMQRKNGMREKSVKRLTVEGREVSRSGRHDVKPIDRKRKRMDGRTYKALFKNQQRTDTAPDDDNDDELEKPDKLSQVNSSSNGGSGSKQVEDREDREDRGDECNGREGEELKEECIERASERALRRSNSSLRNCDGETLKNHVEVELPHSSRKLTYTEELDKPSDGDAIKASKSGDAVEETLGDAVRVLVDCSVEEKLRTPEFVGSASVGRSIDGDVDLGSGDRAILSERKRYTVDTDVAMVSSKDVCSSIPDAVSSPSSGNKRENNDSQKQDVSFCNTTLNKDLCDTSIPECGLDECPENISWEGKPSTSSMEGSIADYRSLPSLLDCRVDLASDGSKTESSDNACKLKEQLSRKITCDYKSDSSRFLEFWVPVQISNVQLEQYCATLLSNSTALWSCSKNDPVGALRDILISTRKCCNHPYIVDPSLQGLITKGLPETAYLDVGIKASGKLQLLDVILTEIKNRQLRVLILFKSIGGSGRDSIGDILDDFLRQRFGPESYERVDGVVRVPSKRQAALSKFNDKESGRFVFLLENNACCSAVKLSSVDTIVIFDSDWNPANDLRALNKISIDSQFEQIMIFRLYSCCTVEEQVLILAKRNLTLDSTLQIISRNTSDMLLMWGASYLFNKLDEFHSASDESISSEQSLMNNVVKEFLALLSQNGKSKDTSNSIILKAQQNVGSYSTNIPLVGELKIQLLDREQPHIFWAKLLKGKNPRWKYSSRQTQRHRKRVQYFSESPKKLEAVTDVVGKKRKKVVANCNDPAALKPGLEKGEVAGVKGVASGILADNGSQSLPRSVASGRDYENRASKPLFSCDNSPLPEVCTVESEEIRTLSDAQKSLHLLLKPEISRLCEILNLPENVKVMVGKFLEYIIENHHVNREPATILQAFLISLVWVAASMLKQKIDREESFALAKKHLNFSCKEEEANFVYSKLRLLKKMFLSRLVNIKESDFSKDILSAADDITREPLDATVGQSVSFNMQNVKAGIQEISKNQEFASEGVPLQQEEAPNYKMVKEEMPKSIIRVQRKCEKRMTKLMRKQEDEMEEFNRNWEAKKVQLDKKHRFESTLVCSIHSRSSVRMDKLKILENEFAKKMEEHECQKDICLRDLKAKQLDARNDEMQKAAHWLAEAKSSVSEDRAHNELPLQGSESENQVGFSPDTEHRAHNGLENVAPLSRQIIEERSSDRIVHKLLVNGVVPADPPETVPNGAVGCGFPTETASVLANPNPENETMVSEQTSLARIEQPNCVGSSGDDSENMVSMGPHYSEIRISDGIRDEEIPLELPETVANEVVGGAGFVEMGTPAVKSNGENDRRDEIGADARNAVGNQNDGANSSISGYSPSTDPSLVKFPSVQPVVSSSCSHSVAQNLVLQNECLQSLASAEMTVEYSPFQGNQSSLQQVEVPPWQRVDAEQTDQSNHEAPLVECLEQSELSLDIYLPRGHNQPDLPPASGVNHETRSEGNASSRNAEASPLLAEEPAELPDQGISQTGANLVLHPPIDATEILIGNNQPDLPSASRVDHQPSGELLTSLQNAEAPQVVEDTAEHPNQAVLQPRANLSVIQGSDNLPLHTEHQLASRMSTLALHADPLQNELERISKETDQAVKVHDDTKKRLKSECEKEIAETIAQIHRKYEAQFQEAEAAFLLKKNELDTNHNKVLMNKTLAEAFRSKCLDIRPSGALGMQQGVPSSFMQQLNQVSFPPVPRHSPFTGSSSAGQPAASQQITAPPLQIVHQSAALFSSILTRPPNINPITPSAGNIRVGGEIRAPAPHIQPFRPASMSVANLASLPRLMPSQQALSSLPSPSPSLPQPSPRPSPQPPPPPLQSLPSLPTNHSGLYNRSPQPESSGRLPTANNSSLLELLRDIDNIPTAHRSNMLPPLNFDSLDLPEFGTTGSVRFSSSPSAVATDVVCLSDDD